MNMYGKNTANFYRNETDKNFVNYNNLYEYSGIINKTMKFLENEQLIDREQWERFVNQYKEDADFDLGWRGEFWGKMMRGACFVYSYTKNPELYEVLKNTIVDMITTQDDEGRISTYAKDIEFGGWDIWNRKYVLLGMQYFLEICTEDDFKEEIVKSMCAQVDYIMSKIGRAEEGKIHITKATRHWRGLNSASLLEPVVRLYSITNEKKYLDFAEYIVEAGGTSIVNIFDLAYEDKLYPYQYPITKAYEMISCFEGLLEFYRITKINKYKTAILNFANKILESDFTVIGCAGCTHEYFDHSTVRQANTNNFYIMQETCVTVTLMKFFYQLHIFTGDVKFADAFERSLYNAYLGSVNFEKIENENVKKNYPDCYLQPLPFDSYSPLTKGNRGRDIGGFRMMADDHYYGCCACIGACGIGLVPKMQMQNSENGFVLNLIVPGTIKTKTASGDEVTFKIETEYPKCGTAKIYVETEKEILFELKIRNPEWSKSTNVAVNGNSINADDGYIKVEQNWNSTDVVEIDFDMRTEAIYPISYGTQILMNRYIGGGVDYVVSSFDEEDVLAKRHIALRRGPIMLAQDSKLGYSLDAPIDVEVKGDGYVDVALIENEKIDNIVSVKVPLKNGRFIEVIDYASAGRQWTEEIAVWMLTE